MHKLPRDFDGAFLVGRTLESVLFSENTVSFGFGDRVSVTVFSSFQHQCPTEADRPNVQSVPPSESRLMQLLGHTVTQASGDDAGTLTIVFDSGHVLKVFDDDPYYECYSINDGQREIFV